MGYRKGFKPTYSGEPLSAREKQWSSDYDPGADHLPEDHPDRERLIELARKWGGDPGGASPETRKAAAEAAERSEGDATNRREDGPDQEASGSPTNGS